MAEQETTPTGYWNWEPAGKPIRILLSLDAVDRMLTTVIDGFGSVPKRGAEVGGLLLGSRSRFDGRLSVTIEDYLPVTCSHRFGPSFVLSDEDLGAFEGAIAQNDNVVGFYRSHTRDGLALGAEDLQYCQQYFNGSDDVMLLIKPSAMKVSNAGFFYYQAGEIQDRTDLEFPFRRSEMETGEAPARRPLGERRPPPRFEPPVGRPPRPGEGAFQPPFQQQPLPDSYPTSTDEGYPEPTLSQPLDRPPSRPSHGLPSLQRQPQYPMPTMSANKLRRNWVWFPLSFIFLLLGVLLGFQAAMSFSSGKGSSQDPYALNLSVERRQEDLALRWDRSNQAIRTASKAVLDIQDGRYSKRVDLDSAQLQTGTVIYRFSTDSVRFKLEVYPRDHIVMSDWVEWKK